MEDYRTVSADEFLSMSRTEKEMLLAGMTTIQIRMLMIRINTTAANRQIAAYRAAYTEAREHAERKGG